MKSCKNLKGGLQEVAEQLDLERIGPQHQAGSDSLLTGMAFFKMREVHTLYLIVFITYLNLSQHNLTFINRKCTIFRCSSKITSTTRNILDIYMV